MRQIASQNALSKPLPAKQARSRRTRDALIAAGWKLLERSPWDAITISDIVKAAGVSVGSFYTRFADKDAFFESLAAEFVVMREQQRGELLAGIRGNGDYFGIVILESYRMTLTHEHFWRAALARGASHPPFWKPFRELGLTLINRVLELRAAELGRELTAAEIRHIRFAFQMANGLINNSLVNRPGPILPDTPEFETELVRGLKAVAGV